MPDASSLNICGKWNFGMDKYSSPRNYQVHLDVRCASSVSHQAHRSAWKSSQEISHCRCFTGWSWTQCLKVLPQTWELKVL